MPLGKVLENYFHGDRIDFISIDTEGYDLEVLKSNNWEKFKPEIICTESSIHHKERAKNSYIKKTDEYLSKIGYIKVYDNGLNTIFKLEEN
jgi:hypothetical protein